ncbi:MAG: DUF3192 domain-containing protein [Candidatus Omnitrophica bacterium]|nr:DUF3192 domain-containing protein [Candidatus Omnitrophota bacterium]
MVRMIIFIACVLTFCGCSLDKNRPVRFSVGMSKRAVVDMVGKDKIRTGYTWGADDVSQGYGDRYKSEVFDNHDAELEVLYFCANPDKTASEMSESEMIPLIFKDGFLAGWGRDYYEKSIPDDKMLNKFLK